MHHSSTLVISHDSLVAAQLKALLEADHGLEVRAANNYLEGIRELERNGVSSVFLDLRRSAAEQNPGQMLRAVTSGSRKPVSLVALTDEGYELDWASLVDAAAIGHLHVPIDRAELSQLISARRDSLSGNYSPSIVLPRVICGQTVSFSTCMPDLFPVLDQLELVAGHDVTLLLVGETGCGKTTLAKLIHELSPRRAERFMTVACGTLPPDLIESELFGHVKGAFTGADRTKDGRFDVAADGTLLLDEIDVLGPKEQAKLLRVIETGEFEPVGSTETHHSAARLIVASNVDLKTLTERNQFRTDLYYRLNVMEFRVPALRYRPMDIVPMALDFVRELCMAHALKIRAVQPAFLAALRGYEWPGNLRELKNHIRRAVLFCKNGLLTASDLALTVREPTSGSEGSPANMQSSNWNLSKRVALTEREVLDQALRAHNQNRTATARALGLSRVGLYKKMKKYGMLASPATNGHRTLTADMLPPAPQTEPGPARA
jgi:DNA-binding NtrC family response regulator